MCRLLLTLKILYLKQFRRERSPAERKRRRSRSRDRGGGGGERPERNKSNRHRRSRSRERDLSNRGERRGGGDRDRRFRGDSKDKRSNKSRRRDKSRSRSPRDSKKGDNDSHSADLLFDPNNLDKEEEQKRLELEMQKRRERIERWRAERKLKEAEMKKDAKDKHDAAALELENAKSAKKWSLENDSEEEEEKEGEKLDKDGEPDVEVDSLDAYMQGVHDEVKKINKWGKKTSLTTGTQDDIKPNKTGVVIVTGVAKHKVNKNKGELIEQNQDGLEYSSEEEQEDLKDTAASIANKQKKELAKVDHNEVQYTSFRKNFYVEVPEIAKMTQEEVDLYKEELEGRICF